MDQFLNKITGGIQAGTNKIEVFNPTFNTTHHQNNNNNNNNQQQQTTPPPGGIQWIFRRETLNENNIRNKVGIAINDELRTVTAAHHQTSATNNNNNNSLASVHASTLLHQPGRWFVVAVNGKQISTPDEFWKEIASALDIRVTLCETAPVDDLLMRITNASPKQQQDDDNNNEDDDDEDFDFSPTIGPQKTSPRHSTNSNNKKNNSDEPDYDSLFRKDPVRYAFTQSSTNHPLYNHWQKLRIKTIKARDALRQLESQLQKDEDIKKEKAHADAMALLDDDSDDEDDDGSGSSFSSASSSTGGRGNNNSDQQQQRQNVNNNTRSNNKLDNVEEQKSAHEFFSMKASSSSSMSPTLDASASPDAASSISQRKKSKKIEGAIPYDGQHAPPAPPSINPHFMAYTFRAEQARKAHHRPHHQSSRRRHRSSSASGSKK